jgi:hypothetical protein
MIRGIGNDLMRMMMMRRRRRRRRRKDLVGRCWVGFRVFYYYFLKTLKERKKED